MCVDLYSLSPKVCHIYLTIDYGTNFDKNISGYACEIFAHPVAHLLRKIIICGGCTLDTLCLNISADPF